MKVGLIKTKGFISDPVGHGDLIELNLISEKNGGA
ncbi:Uncharacterised protein [Acetobacterium wieringae]|nr:Uncharacterised protein [Acetobacterium wieringae]